MRSSTIHPSLQRRKVLMGVGDKAFALEVCLAVVALNLQAWGLLALLVPVHFVLRWLYAKDDMTLNAYISYQREADWYDPWVRAHVRRGRPAGFGRGLHC